MKRLLWFLLLLAGCREPEPAPIYLVPDEVEPYVSAFVEEARLRGMEISVSNLVVDFGTTENPGACGECRHVPNRPERQKRIVLSTRSVCWAYATPQAREALIFHELGHCLLNRNHRDDQLPNGDYASLMNSSYNRLYEPCAYDLEGDNGKSCNQTFKRPYYLNELFDETTPVPAWAQ